MNYRLLLTILLFGFFLRVILLNYSPPSLYGDELTIALDAYSLLKTGHDQLGNLLPLTFPMGAGRPAGYVYGTIPFVAVFGPTALGVRGLSILSGVGIIFLIYLLGTKFFGKKIGLAGAAITAISPWDISLSRGGFEAHFALFLALLGIYLFFKALQKPLLYIFSALSLGMALHTYPTYKVSLLLFLPLLFWFGGIKEILSTGKKYFLTGIIVFLALGILSLSQTFLGGSEARFSNINVLSQESLKSSIEQKINLERQITDMPVYFAKYFYNRPVEYAKVFIENYLQNFSLDFLILHGDRNPRHNMATMGGIYLADFLLIMIGLLSFFEKSKKVVIFLLTWMVLAPLPTAFIDLPHALRSAFMLPPLLILSSLGLITLLSVRGRMFYIIILLYIVQFVFFIQKLYFLAPNEYGNFWSYSAKIASETVLQEKDLYDYILLSDKIDNIEFAYPLYAKVDPRKIINQNRNRVLIGGNKLKKFDNVYIGYIPNEQIEKFKGLLSGSVLFIGVPEDARFLNNPELINGLDGLKALAIEK